MNGVNKVLDLLKKKNVYICGIGGSGMFYLAKFLYLLGWNVSGVDIVENDRVEELRRLGIKIFIEHNGSNLDDSIELLVYSPAVSEEVPEIVKAKKKSIPVVPYNLFLDQVFSELKRSLLIDPNIQKALKTSQFNPIYDIDFSNVKVIGVTGTKGKTTTAMMIYHILRESKKNVGVVTTVSAEFCGVSIDTGFHTTTPTAQMLASILQKMINNKVEYIVLEITSHGLSMHRVEGVPVDIAVYTNITEEHLDYHKTWEDYANSKARMIEMMRKGGVVVLNRDDKSFGFLEEKASKLGVRVVSYGFRFGTILATDLFSGEDFISATIIDRDTNINYPLRIGIIGEYNISNALAAILATKELGIPVADGVYALCSFKGVEGRMEVIQKNPFYAIVDFAHTPDSLEKALIAVKKLVKNKGKIFAIFGCAGLRDPGKRAKMGKIAYKLADVIVVTAEDPRTEKLRDINDQIIEGMGKKIVVYKDVKPTKEILNKELVKGVKVVVRFDKDDISSRRAAINWAIKSAKAGDVVIAFGKGHEKSLCFGTTEYPWSDIEEMKKALVR